MGFFYSINILFIMIYKLEDSDTGNVLECCVNELRTGAIFRVTNENTIEPYDFIEIEINEFSLFQLIGALHTIQKQLHTKKNK